VADWVTISSLATATGTLVLAAATFSSVKSSNRSARIAERALMVGLRPLLIPSRPEDPAQKIGFSDGKWVHVPGGGAAAETGEQAIYLAFGVRNVGAGIAVLHGWRFHPDMTGRTSGEGHSELHEFTRLTRDLYVPVADIGFWQGTFRDPRSPEFAEARVAIAERRNLGVELLYGDHEGGQRMISRFALVPRSDGGWLASVGRHWNLDRADPR
jgi:hypothetical protein